MNKKIKNSESRVTETLDEKALVGDQLAQAKVYQTPVLVNYGDVRDITLGPSIGGGESGCAAVFRNGPGGCPAP